MDIAQIPRTFWHAISFSVLAATVGLLYIAYQSSTISIEIANAKIEISSAISTTKAIKSKLEEENARLIKTNGLLQAKINKLENNLKSNSSAKVTISDLKGRQSEMSNLMEEQKVIKEQFKSLDAQIESAEQFIRKK